VNAARRGAAETVGGLAIEESALVVARDDDEKRGKGGG